MVSERFMVRHLCVATTTVLCRYSSAVKVRMVNDSGWLEAILVWGFGLSLSLTLLYNPLAVGGLDVGQNGKKKESSKSVEGFLD